MIMREEVSKPQGSAYIRKRIEIKRKFFGISSIPTSGREYLRIDGCNWNKKMLLNAWRSIIEFIGKGMTWMILTLTWIIQSTKNYREMWCGFRMAAKQTITVCGRASRRHAKDNKSRKRKGQEG